MDSDAFVFWIHDKHKKVFKAAEKSISQYDTSPDYLLSIGNTYNWDGIWLGEDFSTINPGVDKTQASSRQYEGLVIPFGTKEIKSVKVYQLDMI